MSFKTIRDQTGQVHYVPDGDTPLLIGPGMYAGPHYEAASWPLHSMYENDGANEWHRTINGIDCALVYEYFGTVGNLSSVEKPHWSVYINDEFLTTRFSIGSAHTFLEECKWMTEEL